MKHLLKIDHKIFDYVYGLKKGLLVLPYQENFKLYRREDTILLKDKKDEKRTFKVDIENVSFFDNIKEALKNYSDIKGDIEVAVMVVEFKKHRHEHLDAVVCYLKDKDKVLMLKYNDKWGGVFTPPGGKFEKGESPLEATLREFKEETNLTLIEPKLQGIAYWDDGEDRAEGVIFVYVAYKYDGSLKESDEGSLHWVNVDELGELNQFSQNTIFTPFLFKDEIFESKCVFDEEDNIVSHKIDII